MQSIPILKTKDEARDKENREREREENLLESGMSEKLLRSVSFGKNYQKKDVQITANKAYIEYILAYSLAMYANTISTLPILLKLS